MAIVWSLSDSSSNTERRNDGQRQDITTGAITQGGGGRRCRLPARRAQDVGGSIHGGGGTVNRTTGRMDIGETGPLNGINVANHRGSTGGKATGRL